MPALAARRLRSWSGGVPPGHGGPVSHVSCPETLSAAKDAFVKSPYLSIHQELARAAETSDFLNLPIFQFHGGRTAEDGNRDLDPGAVLVDILDNAIEGSEGAVRDPHRLANFKRNRRFWPVDTLGDLTLDALRLAIGNRHRL